MAPTRARAPAKAPAKAPARPTKPMRPALVDAQRMHREHPASFEVPARADLAALRPGHLVKVSNRKDRFWVTLTEAHANGELVGVVRDRLVGKQRYDAGSLIRLHVRNVYDTGVQAPPRRRGLLSRLFGVVRRWVS